MHYAICALLLIVQGAVSIPHNLHAFLLIGFTPSLQGAHSETVLKVPSLGFSTQQIPLPNKTDHRSGLTIHISSLMVSNETNLSWENEGALLYFSVFHPHMTRGMKTWTTKGNASETSHSLCFNEHCIQVNCLDKINRPPPDGLLQQLQGPRGRGHHQERQRRQLRVPCQHSRYLHYCGRGLTTPFTGTQ